MAAAASASAAAISPLYGASLPRPVSARVSLLPRGSPPTWRLSVGSPRARSSTRCLAAAGGGGLAPEMRATLDKVVGSHKVVLFMKGTKDFPQCGFSHTVVQILRSLDVPFETLDVLANEALRQGLKEYSSWPTFPQLYIDGEFFGGCDITVDAYKSGELQETLEKAMLS
uniref:Glutaredoxin domain-containing protein n=2 Tax=Oryza TaxID=4527 RepID=A0A0E0D9M0_9ORYZ